MKNNQPINRLKRVAALSFLAGFKPRKIRKDPLGQNNVGGSSLPFPLKKLVELAARQPGHFKSILVVNGPRYVSSPDDAREELAHEIYGDTLILREFITEYYSGFREFRNNPVVLPEAWTRYWDRLFGDVLNLLEKYVEIPRLSLFKKSAAFALALTHGNPVGPPLDFRGSVPKQRRLTS